jgi:hypothetical protein
MSESAEESGAAEAQAEVQCLILSVCICVGDYLCFVVSSIACIIRITAFFEIILPYFGALILDIVSR